MNLLTDAYRYGGPHIAIDSHNGAADVTVSVEDDGPGIPAAHGERTFAPLVWGGVGGSSLPRGSGIGLGLAREIVESFGGHLIHESVEPHGDRFLLRLQDRKRRRATAKADRRAVHNSEPRPPKAGPPPL